MVVPLILLALSAAGLAAALMVPGLSDLVLLAAPMVVASLFLLLRAALARRRPQKAPQPPGTRSWRVKPPRAKWIVVDGSNVMHWADETPRIEPLREVVAHLEAQGYAPGVVFDANAGYLVEGRYRHDGAFARLLGLPEDRIMVVPKGTPADPMILTAARDLGARVVTNDRYRDWAAEYPEVRRDGFLVRGGYRDGRLWLDLETQPAG
ncbi:NYN domain-containing protein [Roseicyclus persicicus]|uniref:RNase NYN domain-containing protein n=1 Tax=Roseicyclus persicicus TaxID=2650661 RepID=A0A7X6H085_9RHOB|nr:hypothetical protein [Roseibacterium persicicum]NKX45616.1 hypothetical protein [Roseibacterium persicicum]